MIRVQVPATSANCCIGFDSLGLALEWMAEFTFEPAGAFSITGCPEEYCTTDNLTYQAFCSVFEKEGLEVPPVHIHTSTDIPFARGLGSSSTCVAAGILAADAWLDLHLDDDALLSFATAMEGHPDNVAPALFGGMCACVMEGDNIYKAHLETEGWKALVLIPSYPVSTAMARKVLPESLSLHQASLQAGRALIFERAMAVKDQKLLCGVCVDFMHEPWRSGLIEEYGWCHAYAREHGLPFWISGSGPTLLFLSRDESELAACRRALKDKYPDLETHLLEIRDRKAKVEYV